MGATEAAKTIDVLVKLKVTVSAVVNDEGFEAGDFFEHEIRDALTPDASLFNEMLTNAGLPLVVVEAEPA